MTALPPVVVLRLRGPALKFLHDVSTQDLAGLGPGRWRLAAFLDDKGRVLAEARVLAHEDGAILIAESASREGLERAVVRVAPLAGVEVQVEQWEALRVRGRASVPHGLPEDGWAEADGALTLSAGWDGTGVNVFAPSVGSIRDRLIIGGATGGDREEIEEERIARGRPRFGLDIDAGSLINETPLLEHAVSMSKGCYPGQESVARVHNLGRVRRLLVVLEVDARVEPGDEVALESAAIGRVTSAAGRFALAVVTQDLEPGAGVRVGSASATVAAPAGYEGGGKTSLGGS